MSRKRYTVEPIITKLREAEVELAKGSKTPQVCRKLEISEQTYYIAGARSTEGCASIRRGA